MLADAVSFKGLDDIEARILRRAPDTGYITIKDRTDRSHEEPVGRFDYREQDALPYLEAGANARWRTASHASDVRADRDDSHSRPDDDECDEDARDGDDDTPDDDEGGEDPSGEWPAEWGDDDPDDEEPDHVGRPLTPVDMARAACRWLRDIAVRHCVGEPFRRFRVRIYSPKGAVLIDGGQFTCRNHDADDDADTEAADAVVREMRIPPPSFDQSARDSALKGVKALGDYYAQWGQIVLGSVGQLQGVNNAMMARLHRQLQESRGQVDELVASILEYRHNEIEAHERRRLEERAGDTRTELARDALQQLGTAATAFLAGRSMPPDLLETFSAISASPELTEALRDPGVRTLMKDPDNLRGLAAMLHAAGHQAQAAQQPPGEAATGPPGAGDAPAPDPQTTQPEPPAAD